MELTPEERQRIYLEEKARLEATEQIKKEQQEQEAQQQKELAALKLQEGRQKGKDDLKKLGQYILLPWLIVCLIVGAANSINDWRRQQDAPKTVNIPVSDFNYSKTIITNTEKTLKTVGTGYISASSANGLVSNLQTAQYRLKTIKKGDTQFAEAQKLLSKAKNLGVKVSTARKRSEKVDAAAKAKLANASRLAYAKELEQHMLNEGFDMYVSTSGKANTVLKMQYVLISRPFVYKLINSADFTSKMNALGFKKLIMTDGYDDTYSFTY